MKGDKAKLDEKPQWELLIEAARKAEADETEEGFERALQSILVHDKGCAKPSK